MLNKKISQFVVLIVGSILTSVVFADDGDTRTGPATQYTVTVKKVELCTDSSCSTAHTLVTKTAAMDIASAAVGASVGSYASTMALPPMGVTYSHMRSTIDRTFTIKGYALSASTGNYCYTDGSAGAQTAFAAGTHTTSAATAASSATASALELGDTGAGALTAFINGGTTTVTIDYDSGISLSGDDMLYTVALSSPYTYYGQTPIIDMAFGTKNAVNVMEMGSGTASNDCNLFPGEPNMTITFK
jgi:hypothetical protein